MRIGSGVFSALILGIGMAAAPPASTIPTANAASIAARASIDNPSPAQYSTVTVYGRLRVNGAGVPGLPMTATWYYRTTTSFCSGIADSTGLASCSRRISRATIGYFVRVVVSFRYHGRTYSAGTGFTPN